MAKEHCLLGDSMIKRIKLTYECHKDREIEFKDGFNVIMGSSDSGKSAILRAIFDLYDGTIPTDAVPRGTKDAYVMAEFVDNGKAQVAIIQRQGVTSGLTVSNKWELPDKPSKERVSGNIPLEYQQVVGQHNLVLSNEDAVDVTNIQQFSPMFFIEHSDGDRLKIANVVFGLPKIDAMITRTETVIKVKKSAIKTMSDEKESWENKIAALEHNFKKKKALLSLSESIVKKIQTHNDVLKNLNVISVELESTSTKVNVLQANIKIMSKGIDIKPKLKQSLETLEGLRDIAEEYTRVENQMNVLWENKQKLSAFGAIKDKLIEPIKELEVLKGIKQKISEINPKIQTAKDKIDKMDGFLYVKSALKPAIDELEKLVAEKENLKNTWANVTNTKKKLELITNELLALKEKKKELLNETDVCPLCGK